MARTGRRVGSTDRTGCRWFVGTHRGCLRGTDARCRRRNGGMTMPCYHRLMSRLWMSRSYAYSWPKKTIANKNIMRTVRTSSRKGGEPFGHMVRIASFYCHPICLSPMAHMADPVSNMEAWTSACERHIQAEYKKLQQRMVLATKEMEAVRPQMARLEMCLGHLCQIREALGAPHCEPCPDTQTSPATSGGSQRKERS